ncbi:serine hydrolase, partial [Pseudoalteromonas sp. NZS100_1]|nr:serine hydrolase [Pseudoalteromonas sp. NZS100_1]
ALLVLKDGKIVHETYRLTGGPDVRWLSMSVGKSVVSALVGTAIADGAIKSVDEPVTTYLPGLAGSAYDGVKIKDILGGVCGRGRNPTPSSPR